MKKRGQAALEYLMTYGWAILIVVIVGIALYAMGIFSPGRFTGKSYSGLSEFTILDWKLADNSTNDTFTLVITPRGHTFNLTDTTVTISGVSMSYSGGTCSLSRTLANPDEQITLTCWTNGTDLGSTGAQYLASVTIDYNDVDTGISHTSTGTFKGSME